MAKDPWTNPDPQLGNFGAYSESIVDPSAIQRHEGNPGAKVRLLIGL